MHRPTAWYVKIKLRSIGLKTQKMSLTIINFIGDELIISE